MQIFDDCICIAQARVIAGRVKHPHICTIAYHDPSDQMLRFCLPFSLNRSPDVKRWHRFSFQGDKTDLGNDTRRETWHFGRATNKSGVITEKRKAEIHHKILSHYRYENELHSNKSSIGILIPSGPLKLWQEHLSPGDPEDAVEIERGKQMAASGIWYPDFKVYIRGHRLVEGERKSFQKMLVAWDVYEAIRIGSVNPFQAIYGYRNPYLITGNLANQRRAFICIGVLSAPHRAIEQSAINQQLTLLSA
jgi:hypothetical protein